MSLTAACSSICHAIGIGISLPAQTFPRSSHAGRPHTGRGVSTADPLQPSGRLAHSSRKRTLRPRDPVRYQRRYTAGPRQVHDRLSLIQSLRGDTGGPPCDMTPPLAWRPRPARCVARHGTVPVFRPAADDAHPVTASAAASTGRREPIRQPARPKIRTRPARRPSRTERPRTRPTGIHGIDQSDEQSGYPRNGTNGHGSVKQAVPRTAPSARTLSAICP